MDDLKVYSDSPESLDQAMAKVEELSGAIVGLRKCATVHMKKGKLKEKGDTTLPSGSVIGEITNGSTYKYLGVSQVFSKRQSRR